MTSSPLRPGASLEEELDYYKKQYEQLETDLADFQASSKELEEQLERDIEGAEKNERKLKEQIEKLKYEADEWKTKHQQSKAEANSAQNALQKEITTMRETSRALQLRLRDIEVVNDDYERQARNTEMSLEELDSKYNVAIERGVLLEEEMRNGEQEREGLRIENQRLRDELGELKVESEITLEKLRAADDTIDRLRSRKPSPLAVESLRARSPGSEASGVTPSSPTASTPPPKSDSASEAQTPPSPPLSDAPTNSRLDPKTPLPKRRSFIPDVGTTPRPALGAPRTLPRHSRGPSAVSSSGAPASEAKAMRPPARPRQVSRPSNLANEGLPRSDSLYQIRSLRGRMQKIEERVHSARSKLPAPRGSITPKNSPKAVSTLADALPASVTTRRSVRRPPSNIGLPSASADSSDFAADTPSRRQSRLSTGIPRPPSVASERPTSALDRPASVAAASRPSSRGSLASNSANIIANRPSSRGSLASSSANIIANRPSSRGSLASSSANILGARPSSRIGARTPGADYAVPNSVTNNSNSSARPNSSLGGNYATIHGISRSHRPSASVSEIQRLAAQNEDSAGKATPGRRGTIDRGTFASPLHAGRRQSANLPPPPSLSSSSRGVARRPSTGLGVLEGAAGAGAGAMKPPPPRRQMSDLGETY